MNKSFLFSFGIVFIALAGICRAITVNPASQVTADTSATALTISYRDSGGSTGFNQVGLQSYTTTQLSVLAPATTGQIVFVSILTNGLPGGVFTVCAASSAAVGAWVKLTTTTAPGTNDQACGAK